jgi:hypothetical protein
MPTAWILAAALATTGGEAVPAHAAQEPSPPAPAAAATPAHSPEQRARLLVEGIVRVCEAHPEVERAFVLSKQAADGSTRYVFIPIFDRKVSDAAIAGADAVYKELYPAQGTLEVMLLTRSTWKKMLGGVAPVYVRPGK